MELEGREKSMPTLNQGNIFERLQENHAIAIVFGHIGFNEMGVRWRAFKNAEPTLTHIQDPFSEIPNEPRCIPTGQWLWFVPDQNNHGMPEEELETVLNRALSWAKNEGHRLIITNGISDTDHGTDTNANRYSDNQRAIFLIRYSQEKEREDSVKIELISLNDVFVRNAE